MTEPTLFPIALPEPPKTHALYRFYSDVGELLYVGITHHPDNRWRDHRNHKPWWHEVSSITIQRYQSRWHALRAEAFAIRNEHPRYNIDLPAVAGSQPPLPLNSPVARIEVGSDQVIISKADLSDIQNRAADTGLTDEDIAVIFGGAQPTKCRCICGCKNPLGSNPASDPNPVPRLACASCATTEHFESWL